MILPFRAAAAALLLVAAPAASLSAQSTNVAQSLKAVPLVITSHGKALRFQVEVARTSEQQEIGLMFRKTMPADHGMIFPMSPPRAVSFWMKNTWLPLDLVFIGPDGRIIRIAENAQPLSLDLIECAEPVAAVLELNGGAARKQGIAAGDLVRWQ
ncbi:DUF192 domain-containing protein [Sphingomonas sp. BIUV-7]|uniref:DUF192 domain-containing protein n=1 Tax=Sphingomonas natans TaxID=3063330 RepID=A0ABT8YDG6_9SPHN|nr:DUF192 domain-containing protein [Sphingomonas sp. BIUV-7]MDO6416421.1 DUF192 domain-containing protein [Sphingomonas sp. BIUV-7]